MSDKTAAASLLEDVRKHTEIANALEIRIKAWNRFTRSLVELIAVYDEHPYKTELESLYANIAVDKANRCEKLIEICERERSEAVRKMQIYENMRLK